MTRTALRTAFEKINTIELPIEDNKKFNEVVDDLPIVLADVDQQVTEEDATIEELQALSENADVVGDVIDDYNNIGNDIDSDDELISTIIDSGKTPATETIQLLLNNQRRLVRDYGMMLSDGFRGGSHKTSVISYSIEAIESSDYTRMSRLIDIQERYALESKKVSDYVVIALGNLQKIVINIINSAINLVDLQGRTIKNLRDLLTKIPENEYDERKTFTDYPIFKAFIYSLDAEKTYDIYQFCQHAEAVSQNIKTINQFTISVSDEVLSNTKIILDEYTANKAKVDDYTVSTGDISIDDKFKIVASRVYSTNDPIIQLLAKLFGKSAGNSFCGFNLDGVSLKYLFVNNAKYKPISDRREFKVLQYNDLNKIIRTADNINNTVKQGRSQLGNVQKSVTTSYQLIKSIFEKDGVMTNKEYRSVTRKLASNLKLTLENQKNYLVAMIESNKIITRYVTKSIRVATSKTDIK